MEVKSMFSVKRNRISSQFSSLARLVLTFSLAVTALGALLGGAAQAAPDRARRIGRVRVVVVLIASPRGSFDALIRTTSRPSS